MLLTYILINTSQNFFIYTTKPFLFQPFFQHLTFYIKYDIYHLETR